MRQAGAEGRPGGTLVLVVGASGVGKDSLLDAARAHFDRQPQRKIQFPRRIITRSDSTGENHVFVDQAEFARQKTQGRFFLDWQAHGLSYGVPAQVLDALRAGETVVVNVSRKAIDEARAKWPCIRVVHVATEPDELRRRLIARGRESLDEVERRVARASAIEVPPGPDVHKLDNSGPLKDAARRFIVLLDSYAKG